MDASRCGPGYSQRIGNQSAARKLLYTNSIYTGTGIQKPDYLATVDADVLIQCDLFPSDPPA